MNFRTKLFDYEVEYLNYHLHLPFNTEVDYWKDKNDSYIDWKCDLNGSKEGLQIINVEPERIFLKLYYCIDLDDINADQIMQLTMKHEGEVLDRLQKIEGYIVIDTLVQKDWTIRMDIEYNHKLQPREVFINLMDREIVII